MKDRTKKKPTKESDTFRQHAAEDELHGAHTDVGLSISIILDALPFYVLLIDEHHHILQANSAVRAKIGLEPKDIVGKYCPKVIHGLDEPFYGCPLEEAVEKGQAVEQEALDLETGRWINSAI